MFILKGSCAWEIQLIASSRRENGGAYGGDVFGGKWVVSKGKIFQITCSVSWYGRFWSTTNFWYSWKRAPLPPSSLAGSRRGTEACRAAAGGHGLTTRFVTSISSYSFSYFIQFCNNCHHLGPFILLLVPLLYLLGDLSSPQVHPKDGLLNYIHHLANNLYHHQYSKRSITDLNEIW